ncbi:MAG: 2-oxo acid dehydrogenase subunit E2 [Aminivibrio sp.]|jgi:pyruvate dehydrogenase E2 component (dihydrolipoamide acetyltransferase)|nr:2-oxo acid dehydrogenase subunit E2 [Aminivibrio sp.]
MVAEIVMPKMGLTMTVGSVGKWLKKEGDPVSKGDHVAEVLTEKITNLVDSPADGVLLRISAPEGTTLPIGGVMGYVGAPGEALPGLPPEPSVASVPKEAIAAAQAPQEDPGGFPEERPSRVRISPVARKMAQEHSIDYTRLQGTGPDGRITKEDIEAVLASPAAAPQAPLPASGFEAAPPRGGVSPDAPLPGAIDERPYSGVRRIIGDRMLASWSAAPKVTHHARADAKVLLELRASINETLEKEDRVSVTDMLVKITAMALRQKLFMNVSLRGERVVMFREVHLGVAVALEGALIVPVIRNADGKSLICISRELKDLSRRARENALAPEEISGSTFTLTNLGGYRSTEFFTPVINQPESAILGIGRTNDMPVAVDGEVVVRPMMALSLAHDHRVIDGAPAAEFLSLLIGLVEKPFQVFL